MIFKQCLLAGLTFIATAQSLRAQAPIPDSAAYVTVIASEEYDRSFVHKSLLGRNWRAEWAAPVTASSVRLDTLYGGLTPYLRSGSGESKSLRLRSASGAEYVLRSINKYRRSLLPPLLKHSFYGALVQDGISMSHPYAAFAMPVMLEAAGIRHTMPKLVYIPRQLALDSFNADYADALYLLEERPEGDWSGASHLGGFTKYISTLELKDSLKKTNGYKADEAAFVKARLFDILISDVDRHEGNWRWGVSDSGTFHPIPLDRDQAFFTHNGLLTKFTIFLTRRRWMQSFRDKIGNVATLTNFDTSLDAFFTSSLSREDWIRAATALQAALTDSVITKSIEDMPATVVTASANGIINKLKKRRDGLGGQAIRYYKALARNVTINGSAEREHFEVREMGAGQVAVRVYRIAAAGEREAVPCYHRIFTKRETKALTLQGFGGGDTFDIPDNTGGISLRILDKTF